MSVWAYNNAVKPGTPGQSGLKFKTRAELIEAIESYFTWAENNDKPLVFPRLAKHIGVSVDTLCKYGARDQFGDIILDALAEIEAWTAEATYDRDKFQGAKLNLDIYYKKIAGIKMQMNQSNSDVTDFLTQNYQQLIGQLNPELRTQPEVIEADTVE